MKLIIPFMTALAITVCGCAPVSQSSGNSSSNPKVLTFKDMAYEPSIRTMLLHPDRPDPEATLQPAVTRLGDWNLILKFDDLTTQRDNYYAKIIHCNYDWTKSGLMDLDFMSEYNEFPINNFEFSVDSHIPYNHYWFHVPAVKIPGNYLLIVYRGGDKNDLILSKRFMVFDNQVTLAGERNLIGAGSVASLNQQINFTVSYKDLEVINPMENVKVVIRQNQRWDNLATEVKPSFIREIEKQIEYRFFDESQMFKGGSEFRFFDLRSLNNPGRNVKSVNRTVKPYEAYIEPDKPRTHESYSQYQDLNGGFILENYDYRNQAYSNYAYVNFTLASPRLPGNVYIMGALTNWNFEKENKMEYDSAKKEYYGTLILKQGWYDYQYLLRSQQYPPWHLEGSHFETENSYEIFVYYRPFQPRADMLVGYLRLNRNQR